MLRCKEEFENYVKTRCIYLRHVLFLEYVNFAVLIKICFLIALVLQNFKLEVNFVEILYNLFI